MVTGCDSNTVAFEDNSHNSFEATARGSGEFHHGIEVNHFDVLMGFFVEVIVNTLPHTFFFVHGFAFFNRLVSTVRIDFVCSFSIQPGNCTAETYMFGSENANMVRSEGLAEQAAEEGINFFVSEFFQALVAAVVNIFCNFVHFGYFFSIGVDGNLNTVNDSGVFLFEFSDEDFTVIFESEAFSDSIFGDTHPNGVTLVNMPETFTIVNEVVNTTFENAFKVFLHFAAIDINYDTDRNFVAFVEFVGFRTNNGDFTVFDMVSINHANEFECFGFVVPHFIVHVAFTDGFTFEGRTLVDGDIDFDVGEFNATDFHSKTNDLIVIGFGYIPVIEGFIFVEDLVGNDGETEVDATEFSSGFNFISFTEMDTECHNSSSLVISLCVGFTGGDVTEHHTSTESVVGCVNNLSEVTERICNVVKTEFYVFFHQLFADFVREEEHHALTHQFSNDFSCGFGVFGTTEDNCFAGDGPVNHFDTVFTNNGVTDEAEPRFFVGFVGFYIFQCFDDFCCEESSFTSEKSIVKGQGFEDLSTFFVQNCGQLTESFYFNTAQGADNGEIVSGIGISDFFVCAVFFESLVQEDFSIAGSDDSTFLNLFE